jgi:hypothetical protein
MSTFPFFEVLSYETGLPVSVVVWHVRSVRPIREASTDEEDVTRIEFGNGDVLDISEPVSFVVGKIEAALQPVTGWLSCNR